MIFTRLGVHLLPDRKPAAAGHAALYDTPRYQRFRRLLTRVIVHKWRVAAGVVALFIVAIPHERGEKAVFPHLRSSGSAG